MKTPEQIAAAVAAKLKSNWQHSLVDPAGAGWPQSWTVLPTSTTNSAVAAIGASRLVELTRQWRALAAEYRGISVDKHTWNVHGGQTLPQKVTIADLDTAAALAGNRDCPLSDWATVLTVARTRLQQLRAVNPSLPNSQAMTLLRSTINYSDNDFHLLCGAAQWFATNRAGAHGLTPRQVPLPGIHAKWLNTHQTHVAALADFGDGLGLLPNHAPRIHFTYLDPEYRAAGHRIHDSHTLGDALQLPYQPTLIVISENKDTAILFPPTPGAIAIEGGGNEGATRMHRFDWIVNCPNIIYWGDIDVAGFAIVSAYRNTLPIRTILMDYPTYVAYAEYGTNQYPDGRPIPVGGPCLPNLTEHEGRAYSAVAATAADPRRIEQERIPLWAAAAAMRPISTLT